MKTVVKEEDFIQAGVNQVAAGYVIYGSSTMLVYATRRGVNGFTLDPSIGEWTLSHPDIKCPEAGKIYSVNHGNFFQYEEGVRSYINTCQKKINPTADHIHNVISAAWWPICTAT